LAQASLDFNDPMRMGGRRVGARLPCKVLRLTGHVTGAAFSQSRSANPSQTLRDLGVEVTSSRPWNSSTPSSVQTEEFVASNLARIVLSTRASGSLSTADRSIMKAVDASPH